MLELLKFSPFQSELFFHLDDAFFLLSDLIEHYFYRRFLFPRLSPASTQFSFLVVGGGYWHGFSGAALLIRHWCFLLLVLERFDWLNLLAWRFSGKALQDDFHVGDILLDCLCGCESR
ncbi:MAG: hypothetical protein H0X25_05130 [Acidobacteriales bacterium]|nr:hypothetical protein [Terriglobales bacterium]